MVKALSDMDTNARFRLIRHRFVAGHENCALRHHLDSVPPETPIRDIVDRCRVWESHVDTGARRMAKPERALPVFTVEQPAYVPADQVVAVTAPPVGPGDRTGANTAALPATHGDGDFAGMSTVWSACNDADTATPDWDYGNGNHAAALASGNAGSGLAFATGSGSQGLDYDSVFFLWQTKPRGGQVPRIG